MCIEIDLNAPLIPTIRVLGKTQRIKYDGLHIICFDCGWYDHKQEECSSLVLATTVLPQVPLPLPMGECIFGPWMMPKNYPHRQRENGNSSGPRRNLEGPLGIMSLTSKNKMHGPQLTFDSGPTMNLGPNAEPDIDLPLKPKTTSAAKQLTAASRFQVLDGLPEDSDMDQTVANLK